MSLFLDTSFTLRVGGKVQEGWMIVQLFCKGNMGYRVLYVGKGTGTSV